tara:strand:+ start:293 stop:1015 length:723 start_codon:yes stop_codon:yes gene_type:complete
MATFSTAIMAGSALMGVSNASKMRKQSARQATQALKQRQEQQARVDEEAANYRAMKFTNPYEGMENVFEDLRVSTQAADFQAEQGAQQRADILGQLRGAAGSSGIAGLAQSMANQGQLQARQISAGLQKQEVANELMAAKGASAIDLQQRAGDAMVQQAESGRQSTILGMQYGQAAGANKNYQQSLLNQKNANIAANQMMMNSMQNLASSGLGEGGIDTGGLEEGYGGAKTQAGYDYFNS